MKDRNKLFVMYQIKVDREDQFLRPGFLHIIICVCLGYKVSNFVKNIGCYQCLKKTPQFEGFDRDLVQGLFKQCSHVQIFLLFCKTKPYG